MTIQELARRAGVTPRTIRYYVEQGVLPPPGRGRPAEYTEEHLSRLELVRKLKDQYLPLEEIREILSRANPEEVRSRLVEPGPQAGKTDRVSETASDYIARVLSHGAVRDELRGRPPGQTYPVPQPVPPPSAAPAQTPLYSLPPVLPSVLPPAPTAPAEPSGVQGQGQGRQEMRRSRWERVELAPGIELHFRSEAGGRISSLAARILKAANRVLEGSPDTNMEENE